MQLKAIAQAIGYYARAKKDNTGSGIAVVLNQYYVNDMNKVQIRFILFPFMDQGNYGVQGLLLPIFTCSFEEFLRGEIIKVFLAASLAFKNHTNKFSILLPAGFKPIIARNLIGVITNDEKLVRDVTQPLEQQLQEKDQQLQEKDQRLQEKDQQLQQLQQEKDQQLQLLQEMKERLEQLENPRKRKAK